MRLDYPIIAIGDLHGQRHELRRLVDRLMKLPEWDACSFVFLGDYVDRGHDVRGTIDLVLELLRRPAGGAAVMGNHDLGLVRAARLDGGPPSPYWVDRYLTRYDWQETVESYLGRPPRAWGSGREEDLVSLGEAMPPEHRRFLCGLSWVAEASSHLFLHCGLSSELEATAEQQVEALRRRRWDRSELRPVAGSETERYWVDEYPVWLGADRSLSASPLPYPGRVQVSGHDWVRIPDADEVRIRIDTSGGAGRVTACLLRSPLEKPVFMSSY